MGGFNNNPTPTQFEAAYKRLIVHVELKVSSQANCTVQDYTPILTVSSSKKSKILVDNLDILCAEDDNDDLKENIEVFTSTELTYMNNVIEYISGFITQKLLRTVSCHICLNVLTNTGHNVLNNTLLNIKNRGGLIKPSGDIVLICKTAE